MILRGLPLQFIITPPPFTITPLLPRLGNAWWYFGTGDSSNTSSAPGAQGPQATIADAPAGSLVLVPLTTGGVPGNDNQVNFFADLPNFTALATIVIGVNSGSSTPGGSLAGCAAGNTIILAIATSANDSFSSVTDSLGNTYSLAVQSTPISSASTTCIAYCLNVQETVPFGVSWTATTVNGSQWTLKFACAFTGLTGLDKTNSISSNTAGTSLSISSGTLSSSNEIAVAFTEIGAPSSGGTITPPTGWSDQANSNIADFAFLAQFGTNAAVTDNPSWTISNTYSSVLATFTAGNTWNIVGSGNVVNNTPSAIAWSLLAADIPMGSYFGATVNDGSSQWAMAAAVSVSGVNPINPLDISLTASTTGSGSGQPQSISQATGTLAEQHEFLFAQLVPFNTLGFSIVDSPGFTRYDTGHAYGDYLVEYAIVNSTNSVTWAPSWSTQTPFAWTLLSFKGH